VIFVSHKLLEKPHKSSQVEKAKKKKKGTPKKRMQTTANQSKSHKFVKVLTRHRPPIS